MNLHDALDSPSGTTQTVARSEFQRILKSGSYETSFGATGGYVRRKYGKGPWARIVPDTLPGFPGTTKGENRWLRR